MLENTVFVFLQMMKTRTNETWQKFKGAKTQNTAVSTEHDSTSGLFTCATMYRYTSDAMPSFNEPKLKPMTHV